MQFMVSARRSGSSRYLRCVCLAAAALGATSCATTAGGGRQTRLLVTTEPPGVTLYVNGANMGPTPARIVVTLGESWMVAPAHGQRQPERNCPMCEARRLTSLVK
jgi:hypothetical protein